MAEKQRKTAKNRGGRPAHKPDEITREAVKVMAASGMTHQQIADVYKITRKTLAKHYHHELENGKALITAKIADSLMRQAMAGNMTAAIFYLKCQAGWKESQVIEHQGKDGAPITFSLENASVEQLKALEAIGAVET